MHIKDAVYILKEDKIETNKGIKINKRRLLLFMLTFNSKEKPENVFKIKAIHKMRVKIEPLKINTRLIPQCKKCQGFNHTQKSFRRETKCVKYAIKHNARDCTEHINNPAKCIKCKGKGCEVAIKLQTLKNKTRLNSIISKDTVKKKCQYATKTQGKPSPNTTVTQHKSFSQILQQSSNIVKVNLLEKIFRRIEAINVRLAKQERDLKALFRRLGKQETANKIS